MAYAASAWVALQVLDVSAEPWGISAGVVRAAQIAVFFGFFVVLVLAWYHGEQGRQRVSGPELVIIAGILLVSGLLSSRLIAPGDPIIDESMEAVMEPPLVRGTTNRPGIAVLPPDEHER